MGRKRGVMSSEDASDNGGYQAILQIFSSYAVSHLPSGLLWGHFNSSGFGARHYEGLGERFAQTLLARTLIAVGMRC